MDEGDPPMLSAFRIVFIASTGKDISTVVT
jgi:hypothetical protein